MQQCLDSARAQTISNIEIICVDDGSTDDSRGIVRTYMESDARIRLLEQQNAGGGAARNHGMSVARGEFLYFLDADDWIEPNLLELALSRCVQCDSDLVAFPAFSYDDLSGEQWSTDWVFDRDSLPSTDVFSYQDMPNAIFNTFGNVPWNKVFRRSFVADNKLQFQEIFRTNDLLFVCKALMLAKRISVVDQHLVHYRVGTTQNCQSTNDKEPLGFYKAFAALREFLVERGMYDDVSTSFANHALDGFVSNMMSLNAKDSFDQVVDMAKKEARGTFQLGALQRSEARDLFKFDLFHAVVDSPEGAELFQWDKTMLQYLNQAWKTMGELYSENNSLVAVNRQLQNDLSEFESSYSYRLGRVLLTPFRWLRSGISDR